MDWYKYNWFWHGIESGFEPCCISFFMHVWHNLDNDIRDNWTSTEDGYIPCPDCLVRLMEEENLS
jgi:hypothetical protein